MTHPHNRTDKLVGCYFMMKVARAKGEPMAFRISAAEFGTIVEQVLKDLPEQFAQFLETVPVQIMDAPDRRMIQKWKIEPDVLGLYCGPGLTETSIDEPMPTPRVIYLFQRKIESICRSREELLEEIRITLLHEIGHHFGMDEQDLEELGYD